MRKALAVIGSALTMLVVGASVAFAQTDPSSVVGGGAETIKNELLSIASTVLPYAAVVLAVIFGWRLAKRFVAGR